MLPSTYLSIAVLGLFASLSAAIPIPVPSTEPQAYPGYKLNYDDHPDPLPPGHEGRTDQINEWSHRLNSNRKVYQSHQNLFDDPKLDLVQWEKDHAAMSKAQHEGEVKHKKAMDEHIEAYNNKAQQSGKQQNKAGGKSLWNLYGLFGK